MSLFAGLRWLADGAKRLRQQQNSTVVDVDESDELRWGK
jgi:hypothetical protein